MQNTFESRNLLFIQCLLKATETLTPYPWHKLTSRLLTAGRSWHKAWIYLITRYATIQTSIQSLLIYFESDTNIILVNLIWFYQKAHFVHFALIRGTSTNQRLFTLKYKKLMGSVLLLNSWCPPYLAIRWFDCQEPIIVFPNSVILERSERMKIIVCLILSPQSFVSGTRLLVVKCIKY